jgi:hypothetical protein
MRNIYTKDILLGIIGILIILISIFPEPIYVSIPYSVYNTKWNGCSEFYKFTNTYGNSYIITSPHNLNDYKNGVIFIIAPTEPLTKSEIDKIRKYLLMGNDVVIIDDEGVASNVILKHLGIDKKIASSSTYDIFYEKNYSFPEVKYKIEGFEGIVVTSIPSYIKNPSNDIVETSGVSKKVIADVEHINNSKLIIISDPDIFTNSLKNYNIKFWKTLLFILNKDNFYFDELHHSGNEVYGSVCLIIPAGIPKILKALLFVIASFSLYLFGAIMVFGFEKIKNMLKNILFPKKKRLFIPDSEIKEIILKIKEGRNYGWKRTTQ